MYRPFRRLPLWFLVTLTCLLLLPGNRAAAQGPPPAKVVVAPVTNDQLRDKVVLIGSTQAWRASTVASEIEGRVAEIKARRGDSVNAGAVLARLADSDVRFRLQETRARRDATASRLEKAKDSLNRAEELKLGQAIAESAFLQARLTVQELDGDLAAIEAEIHGLEDALENKSVKAPFAGVVTRELTEVGQWVEKGGNIVHLLDLSKVRVVVNTPEQYVSGIKTNEKVDVWIDAVGRTPFAGRVHALIPEGNREARVFPMEVEVPNEGSRIKEGMLARVEFNLGISRKALMVHKDAVITRGARTYIFVVSGSEAKQVSVSTGSARGDYIEISGPVDIGANAVIRGNERLRDGQAVQVVSSTE